MSIFTVTGQAEPSVTPSTQTQILAVVAAIAFLGLIVELVRRRKLEERYTVVWFLAAVFMLAVALVPGLLGWLADRAGIASPNAALFALILLVAGLMLLNLTVVVSRQSEHIRRLTQELAILRSDTGEHRVSEAPPDDR